MFCYCLKLLHHGPETLSGYVSREFDFAPLDLHYALHGHTMGELDRRLGTWSGQRPRKCYCGSNRKNKVLIPKSWKMGLDKDALLQADPGNESEMVVGKCCRA